MWHAGQVSVSNAGFPTTLVRPSAQRGRLPYRADAVDPYRLGELPFVEHLFGSLVADAEVGTDVPDAKGAALAHAAERKLLLAWR
jgi:hypothetical protein